jgi:DNA-binding CsgD family transcriptional regulator
MEKGYDYKMFMDFIEMYRPWGFLYIKRTDPFLVEIEERLHDYKQFFFLADAIRVKIIFISSGIQELIGIKPEQVDTIYPFIHPDDILRHDFTRTKLMKVGQDIFIKKEGTSILSTTLKLKNPSGNYINYLFQTYLFYSEIPNTSVYHMTVLTDISQFSSLKTEGHFYIGNDPKFFRFPDKALLETGTNFTSRELNILKFIAEGLDSKAIAKKLSLSVNTVIGNRKNILKKSGKSSMIEIIIELMERGVL